MFFRQLFNLSLKVKKFCRIGPVKQKPIWGIKNCFFPINVCSIFVELAKVNNSKLDMYSIFGLAKYQLCNIFLYQDTMLLLCMLCKNCNSTRFLLGLEFSTETETEINKWLRQTGKILKKKNEREK
jgi:hypothetical protein